MYISSAESKKSKSFFFFFLPNIDESLVTFFCVSVVLWFCFKREISLFLFDYNDDIDGSSQISTSQFFFSCKINSSHNLF